MLIATRFRDAPTGRIRSVETGIADADLSRVDPERIMTLEPTAPSTSSYSPRQGRTQQGGEQSDQDHQYHHQIGRHATRRRRRRGDGRCRCRRRRGARRSSRRARRCWYDRYGSGRDGHTRARGARHVAPHRAGRDHEHGSGGISSGGGEPPHKATLSDGTIRKGLRSHEELTRNRELRIGELRRHADGRSRRGPGGFEAQCRRSGGARRAGRGGRRRARRAGRGRRA